MFEIKKLGRPATKGSNIDSYKLLQQHLDSQPVRFPSTSSGVELKILQHIFTPEQALVATCLTHRHESFETIYKRAGHLAESSYDLSIILDKILKKGGIEITYQDGKKLYANTPLVVGMYELQIDRLTPSFIDDFEKYSADKKFGLSFLGTRHSQMRTIPIHKSIKGRNLVATYDDIRAIIKTSDGPFVILECICRKKKAMAGIPCKQTTRKETCLAMGHVARSLTEMDVGRTIQQSMALEIMEENQKDGLVLQPANAINPDFVCSCCSCCCGMLSVHRNVPRPVSFWDSSYMAVIDKNLCIGCGICETRCQTGAIVFKSRKGRMNNVKKIAGINRHRCIGCGLCVTTCPAGAITLIPVRGKESPPENRQALFKRIQRVRKDPLAKVKLLAQLIWDMVITRDFSLLFKK